jgi:hypothetical protein
VGIQQYPVSATIKKLNALTVYDLGNSVNAPPPSSSWATLLEISDTSGFFQVLSISFSTSGGSSGGSGHIELRLTIDGQQTVLTTTSQTLGSNSMSSVSVTPVSASTPAYMLPIVWENYVKVEYRTVVDSGTFSFSQSTGIAIAYRRALF